MKQGLYICKVKGLKFCDYTILMYNEDGWWRYYQDHLHDIEGWVGNNMKILEVKQLIEEL